MLVYKNNSKVYVKRVQVHIENVPSYRGLVKNTLLVYYTLFRNDITKKYKQHKIFYQVRKSRKHNRYTRNKFTKIFRYVDIKANMYGNNDVIKGSFISPISI